MVDEYNILKKASECRYQWMKKDYKHRILYLSYNGYKKLIETQIRIVKEYILFIDTEASGLPKNWDLPYSANDNWPYCVQLAWVIYTKDGNLIKEENHFIKNKDFKITKPAQKIHGITREYLDEHGKDREEILQSLAMKKNIGSSIITITTINAYVQHPGIGTTAMGFCGAGSGETITAIGDNRQ